MSGAAMRGAAATSVADFAQIAGDGGGGAVGVAGVNDDFDGTVTSMHTDGTYTIREDEKNAGGVVERTSVMEGDLEFDNRGYRGRHKRSYSYRFDIGYCP
jgi:hypothetical protein